MPLLPSYDERCSFDYTAEFVDDEGAALEPVTAQYSIYDRTNDTVVKDLTDFTIDTETGEATIEVLADDLAIIDDANAYEQRVLTTSLDMGGGKELHREYWFKVKNLVMIGRPEEVEEEPAE
jgi:hypothetical protein